MAWIESLRNKMAIMAFLGNKKNYSKKVLLMRGKYYTLSSKRLFIPYHSLRIKRIILKQA